MSESLHHKLSALHQSLLHGKLPRTLHWKDALDLIEHLGRVEPRGDDEYAFVVGTQRQFFKRPRTPEFGTDEVSRLRRFLKSTGPQPSPIAPGNPGRMVVVIDHHAAHIFHDIAGIRLQHWVTVEAHSRGDQVPEESSFYGEVATALVPANEIVLIGHGTGKCSAVNALAEHLEKHYPELSRLVKATETVDLSSLTEAAAASIATRHMTALA